MTRKGGHQIFVSNRISMHIMKQLQRTSKGVDVFMSSDVRSRAQFVRCMMVDYNNTFVSGGKVR